jgi:hypothetical protein
MSWSSSLPIARDRSTCLLFCAAVAGSVLVLEGIQYLGTHTTPPLTRIYLFLLERQDFWGAAFMLLTLLAALFVPSRLPAAAFLRWIGGHPYSIAFATFMVLCVSSLWVYHNHPLAMDEYAQVFQSRVFAAGHLTGRFPAPLMDWLIPHGFQQQFLFVSRQTGEVASVYWPSFALLLTPFTFLGMTWACNPCISAVTLIVAQRLAMRCLGDLESAGLVMLLTAASPVFFANGISFYSMPAHLLANCLFALLLIDPTPRRAFAAGMAGSIALTLHNPVPHILFAIPWLLWLATRPGGFRLSVAAGAGYAPLCLVLGLGWFELTAALHAAAPQAADVAGTQPALLDKLSQVFALPDGGVLLARLTGIAKIWVWAVPGLMVLAVAGAFRWRDQPWCRLMLCSALVTLLGYLFVPMDQGHGWGYRYFHSAWIALPLLAAAAVKAKRDAQVLTIACALLTLGAGVGLRARQIHDFIGDQLEQVPLYAGSGPHLIIIDPRFGYYAADLVQNDPWLRGNEIRMITRGRDEDADMMRRYFPQLHRVSADNAGTVWAAAQTPAP